MSGGYLNYAHSKLRHNVIEPVERGAPGYDEGVKQDEVAWDVDETTEYLDDLAMLLKAYSWWKCGDTGEESYREAEAKFMEKWGDA